jgi:hypothetical protein
MKMPAKSKCDGPALSWAADFRSADFQRKPEPKPVGRKSSQRSMAELFAI